jgi:hypothetical protein
MCKTLPFLARRAAAALIVAPLMFGTVSLPVTVSAAPVNGSVHAVHGAWQSFSLASDNGTLFGAMTKMSKGGTAAFVIGGDSVTMFLSDQSWDLDPDRKVRARVRIDSDTLTGTAMIVTRTMVEMRGISREALRELAAGAKAVIHRGHVGRPQPL